MGHASRSPSSAKRWMVCAAAPAREARYPDENSPASMAGTNAHAYLEAMVRAMREDAEPDGLPHPEAGITPELIEQARACFRYAVARQKALKPAALRPETLVNPAPITRCADGAGTADIILVANGVLEVIDLKTGGSFVSEDDPQLKIYGLGALCQYYDPKTQSWPFETVRLTVFQPKRPGASTIERWVETTPADLVAWANEDYVPAYRSTENPNAVGTPTEQGCHFCKARKDCPDRAAVIQTQLEAMFPMSQTTTGADTLLAAKSVAEMSVEELGAFLDATAHIKAKIKDAEERADALLKDRVRVPGWKLVRGNSRRLWTDPAAVEAKCKELKIKPDVFAPRVLLSVAQMQNAGLPQKKWEELQSLVETKAGNLVLVPETDARQDAVPLVTFDPVAPAAEQPASTFEQMLGTPPPAAAAIDLSAFGL